MCKEGLKQSFTLLRVKLDILIYLVKPKISRQSLYLDLYLG